MSGYEKFVELFTTYWPVFGVAALEIVMRIWPSDKIRSIFSIIGKILIGLGKISHVVADALSHYIPDNTAPEE